MENTTPRALRVNITLLGRRNAGKSSLINALTGQQTAIVSPEPGTTTDPVAKAYELLPLGAVTFFDTAGLDDEGELGALRIKATKKTLFKTDIAVVVIGRAGLGDGEKKLFDELRQLNIPFLTAFNHTDTGAPAEKDINHCRREKIPFVCVSAKTGEGIDRLKEEIIRLAPAEMKKDPLIAGDLVKPGDTVILVVPIDSSAPKGRLILPQVQVLRELLDCGVVTITVKDTELAAALAGLKTPPALVITDSQVVARVANTVAPNIRLTTFSTLFARNKGDIGILLAGADKIDNLADGDKILIAEACSHHRQEDDIGRVKIPAWIRQYSGKELTFEFCSGTDFPDDLEKYALVVHCGACMLNRAEMLRRLRECVRRGVAVTNYGVAISKTRGLLGRISAVFA